MSRENAEIVRQTIEANRSGDLAHAAAVAIALADPKLEFRSVLSSVEGGAYRGHEGVRRYFDDMADAWQEWRSETGEILEMGPELLLADVHFRGVGHSGMKVETHSTFVVEMSGGKILSMHAYPTRGEALEAAGLRE